MVFPQFFVACEPALSGYAVRAFKPLDFSDITLIAMLSTALTSSKPS
jgi:hypothetical protein